MYSQVRLGPNNFDQFAATVETVVGVLEPIYGSQNKAVEEWRAGHEWKQAFVVKKEETGDDVGFLVVKDKPQRTFKISTLFCLPGHRGQKAGEYMLDLATQLSRGRDMLVTVSHGKDDALAFFQRNGFEVITTLSGKYRPNVVEYVLMKRG